MVSVTHQSIYVENQIDYLYTKELSIKCIGTKVPDNQTVLLTNDAQLQAVTWGGGGGEGELLHSQEADQWIL